MTDHTGFTPDATYAKQQAIAKLKSRAITGTVAGAGIAVGSAATDVALAGAAVAATVVATAAAESVIVPIVLTTAAVAGAGVLIYMGGRRLQKWWRTA